jgi:glycosyltransferase involved in cell wall biosynthesis
VNAHILVIADGRSPTARSWISNLQSLGFEVSLISTFPCEPPDTLRNFHMLPVAFSRFSPRENKAGNSTQKPTTTNKRTWMRHFAPVLLFIRYIFGPLTVLKYQKEYAQLVQDWNPDLVHALRIPYEGMLGCATPASVPFIAATWGNDLTLHASGSFLMRWFTRQTLKRANGLTSDTHRDVTLAHQFGLGQDAPTLVVPGSGGVDLEAVDKAVTFEQGTYAIPENAYWVVNPRGLRPGSVHQDTFFTAMPIVLKQQPKTIFLCPGLAQVNRAHKWAAKYDIETNLYLLPKLEQSQLWAVFKRSSVIVSPSSHDGTPNTLLEAMACGCFPVAGDIESLREWIVDGENGLLVDPTDPEKIANAIVTALANIDLRQKSAVHNRQVIEARASKRGNQEKIAGFYQLFL